MIAVDSNILIYSMRMDSPWYADAFRAVQILAEGDSLWTIPWPCVHEFLAIVTNPKVYKPPTPTAEAFKQIRAWFASPSFRVIGETQDYLNHLEDFVTNGKAVGGMVHDARNAAICRANQVREIWSSDRDYSRFHGVKIRNPLIEKTHVIVVP